MSSPPPTLGQRVRTAVKEFLSPSAPAGPWYLGDLLPGPLGVRTPTRIDYRAEAGPPDSNAIVMACVHWIQTTFPEAPIRVQRTTGAQVTPVPDHPLTALLDTPNPYYTGLDLWAATLADYTCTGNGYWVAPLNRAGRPVELWYEPHFSIRPRGTADALIAWWEVYRAGTWIRLDPRENLVVHFRRGVDPHNPRAGISPLVAAYREIYSDNEAAAWTATLLRNTGIPGVIIAPKGTDVLTNPDKVKQDFMAKFTGDRRGEPQIMTKPTDVYKLDWSPAEMDLTTIRRLPEERITALLGIPASVVGLGAGLDRNTYSNAAQEDDKAWHNNIIPAQRRFAATLQLYLLPRLGSPAIERVSFDLSQVKALQDDASALYTRLAVGYDSGWLKRGEARQAAGWPPAPDGSDDVYKPGPTTGPPSLPTPTDRPPPKARPAPPAAKAAPPKK